MTEKIVYAKYIGAGAFIAGVPACDLSREEWDALSEAGRKSALEAGTHKLTSKSGEKAAEVNNGFTS